MKLLKKLFAVMFALTLVIGMGTRVSAEGTPTPDPTETVTGADYDPAYFTAKADAVDLVGHTFNAVQIVKAKGIDTTKNPPVYTGLSWGAQITDNGAALLTALQAEDCPLKADFANFVTTAPAAEGKELFTAAAFAATIQEYIGNAAKLEALIKVVKGLNLTGQTITVGPDTMPAELTAGIGLYMIDDTTTVTGNDDTANATILMAAPGRNTINIKVDQPSQDKEVLENTKKDSTRDKTGWNEVSDYNIGDYVLYMITSKVPDAEKFTNYTMKFTDTMSKGLTFADSITGVADTYKLKVKVGNSDLAPEEYTLTSSAQGFTLELPVKTNGTQTLTAGNAITITFYGLLNKNAEIGLPGNTNKSKLEFSNNPDDDTSKGETPEDTVITFTYELDVNKIDGDTKAKLAGALFALKATAGDHKDQYAIVDGAGKISGWTATKPTETTKPDTQGNTPLLVSDANGDFKVIGLDDGTYSLEEIKAPKGYNKIDPIELVVKATTANGSDYTDDLETTPGNALTKLELDVTANGKTTTSDGDAAHAKVATEVANNSGAVLPSTGGIGTTIFYVLGGLLVAGAGIVLVARKKASE